MARINLLPWRETERKRRQQDFAVATAVALAIIAGLGLAVHFQMQAMVAGQRERNVYLESQIAVLDAQIKKIQDLEATKAKLIARMNIIQQLQESRPEVVHLFDELVRAMPDGAFLTKVEQTGAAITVEGQAQSNARVSALMRNIEASGWVGNPSLQLIESKDQTGTGLSRFRLRLEQRQSADEPSADGKSQGAPVPGGRPGAKGGPPPKPT
jgi:type IV pilus assembly protein PilN